MADVAIRYTTETERENEASVEQYAPDTTMVVGSTQNARSEVSGSTVTVDHSQMSSVLWSGNFPQLASGKMLHVHIESCDDGWSASVRELDVVVQSESPETSLEEVKQTLLDLYDIYSNDEENQTADARELAQKLTDLFG